MRVISSREFRDNQKKYFDLVDNEEQIIIQRGKTKAYIVTPVSEIDRMSLNPELIEKIRKAEENIARGEYITIDPNDSNKSIWEQMGFEKNENE